MCDKRALVILRRVGVVFFAVLFALLLPVCGVLCVLNCGFSSFSTLAESLVDESYLSAAEGRIRESFEDVALLYGVESELLTSVLDESRDELRVLAVSNVRGLLDSVVGKGAFVEAEFDPERFRAALRDHAEGLAEEQGMEVQEEAVDQLSLELSAIVSEALSPVGGGLFREAAERLQGLFPTRLYENLGLLSLGFLFVLIVCLAAVFLLSPRTARLRAASATLFCGATLYFVPTYFLLSRLDVSALVLTDGVLFQVIRGVYLRFVTPLRISSLVLFVLATVLLFVIALLFARAFERAEKEPTQEASEDTTDGAKQA